jgi:hypothetical protein
MTGESRSLLSLNAPAVASRPTQPLRDIPRLAKPGGERQAERLTPQFDELVSAFEAERAQLASGTPDEIDPALVVVMDLAGSVEEFGNAIAQIGGLEFLTEFLGERTAADDDFYMAGGDGNRTEGAVPHSLYLMMSNASAIDELIRLFELWQHDEAVTFNTGLGRFKSAFHQLKAIRRWGPEDRVRETGLVERWRETLDVVGQSKSSVRVEIELWYRQSTEDRRTAQKHVETIVSGTGGRVIDRSEIQDIQYHALLAELPIQQAQSVLGEGAGSIELLATEDVMFVSPFAPMTVGPVTDAPVSEVELSVVERVEGLPRVALLDGLPLANHDALIGRLIIDDPDDLGADYPVSSRNHGTAMASLIVHGDLSLPGEPLHRPVYARPIMRPHEMMSEHEQVVPTQLFPDLLHRAIRRIVDGEDGRPPAAPSVRIVNLSIGDESRALVRRMSPVGRLLDWLALSYNLLFVVSAGNHGDSISIPADAATDAASAGSAAASEVHASGLLRGILPPGDALNALTIGATHDDALATFEASDTAWDILDPGAPALYSATGPGVGRSVKPDLHHAGGRSLYTRPVVQDGDELLELESAETSAVGPGTQVAAPGRMGATNNTVFSVGTSNATALVTREASHLFDVLEAGPPDADDTPFPDALYHPLLVRALLAHACAWGDSEATLRHALDLDPQSARRRLTSILGYGVLDVGKLGAAATNRAVLMAGGAIARDKRHTYEVPLPPSLRARAEWHRITITLASMVPTVGHLSRYRGAKVYFDTPDQDLAAGARIEADHTSVRRGSLQHEIVDGKRAMVFNDGETFPIHVECMNDALRLRVADTVRYALVASIETAVETSATIHEEVRERLLLQIRERARGRVAG